MSNWICKECGATYIDVSHQEPSVLKQELELRKLKEVLFKCREKLDQLEKENQKLKAIKEKTYNYDYLSECYSKFIMENKKLKELMKECRDEINPYIEVIGGKKTFKNLIDKIDEVLK